MTLKISPTPIGTSNTEIYVTGAGLEGSIHGLVFSNNSDSNANVSVVFYKALEDTEYTLAQSFPVSPRKSYVWPRPLNVRAGDKLSAAASSNNVIFATASVYEAETFSQGFNIVGEWNDSAEYQPNDVVSYNGSGYAAITTNTDAQPDTSPLDWIQIASAGPTGFTGSQGIQGDVGFTGSVGFAGSQGTVGSSTPRALTVYNPTSSESITLFYTTQSITLDSVRAVVTGTTPSVTFSIESGADRSTVTTTHVNAQTVTNTTTGVSVTVASSTIPADRWVWLTTSAVSGVIDSFNVSLLYT
jgi:hypothetical protein